MGLKSDGKIDGMNSQVTNTYLVSSYIVYPSFKQFGFLKTLSHIGLDLAQRYSATGCSYRPLGFIQTTETSATLLNFPKSSCSSYTEFEA